MEVDGILLLTLRQVGCDLPEDASTLDGLQSKTLVNVVGTCLRIITGQQDIPIVFSEGTSGKFRVANTIAGALEAIGCPYEVQFNQLMYPNDKESRNIISWLVSRLPRQEEKGNLSKANQSLLEKLHNNVSALKSGAFHPVPRESVVPSIQPQVPGSRSFSSRPLRTPVPGKAPSRFETTFLSLVSSQVVPSEKLSSLLEQHSQRVAAEADAKRESAGLPVEAKRERTTRLIAGAFKKRSGNLRSDANRRMEEILELFSGDTKMGSSRFQRETSFAQEEGDTTRQIAQDLVKANEEEEEARRAKELADAEREIADLEMQISATEQDIRKYRALGTKAEEDLALLQEQTPELEEEHSVKRRVHDLLEDFEGGNANFCN